MAPDSIVIGTDNITIYSGLGSPSITGANENDLYIQNGTESLAQTVWKFTNGGWHNLGGGVINSLAQQLHVTVEELGKLSTTLSGNGDQLQQEIHRAQAAEQSLQAAITNNAQEASNALQQSVAGLNNAITDAHDKEAARATEAEANLQSNISQLGTDISSETSRAKSAEASLQSGIDTTKGLVDAETKRAQEQEANLSQAIATNASNLTQMVNQESAQRRQAESTMSDTISSNFSTLSGNVNSVEANLGNQISSLSDNLNKSTTQIQGNIDAEKKSSNGN